MARNPVKIVEPVESGPSLDHHQHVTDGLTLRTAIVMVAPMKTTLLDWASATTLYVGWADPGTAAGTAAWYIRRITFNGSGQPTAVEHANGVLSSNIAWTARAAQAYS